MRQLPQNDLTFLQASPSECNTLDGNCLRLSIDSGFDNVDLVIDDPQEIPCEEILCHHGYEAVKKPEGCQCIKSRPQRRWGGGPSQSLLRSSLVQIVTTKRPENLRIVNENAKKYLIWMHDFINRRHDFANKVMGRI